MVLTSKLRLSEPNEYYFRLYTLNEVCGGYLPLNHGEKHDTRIVLTALQADVPENKKVNVATVNRNRIEHALIEAAYTTAEAVKEDLKKHIDSAIIPFISIQQDLVVSKVTGDKYLGESST